MGRCDLARIARNLAGDLKTTRGVKLTPTIRETISTRLAKLRGQVPAMSIGDGVTTTAGSTDCEVADRNQGASLIGRAAEDVAVLLASCSIGEVPGPRILDPAIVGLERGADLLDAGRPPASVLHPKKYLSGWREILDALELKNDETNRGRVARLNEDHAGPIITPGRGAPPKVVKDRLLVWWNSLEKRFQEIQQRDRDRQATSQIQHDYGRDGQVAPEIGGAVKKRRGQT